MKTCEVCGVRYYEVHHCPKKPREQPSIDPMIWENLRDAANTVRSMTNGAETPLSLALHKAARLQDASFLTQDGVAAAIIKAWLAQQSYKEAIRAQASDPAPGKGDSGGA